MYISLISQSQFQSWSNGQGLRSCASASWVQIPPVITVPVAQLVRAVVLSTIGREFNSHREQKYINLLD
jgi:hypothetical protein